MPENNYSIRRMNVQPATFNPIVYSAPEYNVQPLMQSLATIEARAKEQTAQESNVMQALGKVKAELHDDAETKAWIDQYEKDLLANTRAARENGDYADSINFAIKAGAKAASDPAILGRIQANTDWKQKQKNIQDRELKGDIERTTGQWWRATHDYAYEPIISEGKEIGGSLKQDEEPVDDINLLGFVTAAFKSVTPEKNDFGTSRKIPGIYNKPVQLDKNGMPMAEADDGSRQGLQTDISKTGLTGVAIDSSTSNRDTYERVTKQRIIANVKDLMADPKVKAQLEQKFEVTRWQYKERQKEIEELLSADSLTESQTERLKDLQQQQKVDKDLLTINDAEITDYKQWINRYVLHSAYVSGLVYDWRTHMDSSGEDWSIPRATGGGGGGGEGGDNPQTVLENGTLVPGPSAKKPETAQKMNTELVTGAASRLGQSFIQDSNATQAAANASGRR